MLKVTFRKAWEQIPAPEHTHANHAEPQTAKCHTPQREIPRARQPRGRVLEWSQTHVFGILREELPFP